MRHSNVLRVVFLAIIAVPIIVLAGVYFTLIEIERKEAELDATTIVANPYDKSLTLLHEDTLAELQLGVVREHVATVEEWQARKALDAPFYVYFFLPNCVDCIEGAPIFDALESSGAEYLQINAVEHAEELAAYGVEKFPTLIAYINGVILAESTGKLGEEPMRTFMTQTADAFAAMSENY